MTKKKNAIINLFICLMLVFVMGLSACTLDMENMGSSQGTQAGDSGTGVDESGDKEDAKEEGLPAPKFSKEAGFYSKEFDLALTAQAGAQIYYTLDGSDPRESETAILYKEEIKMYNNTYDPNVYSMIRDISLNGYYPPEFNVDKAMVVRAVAKYENGEYGNVATNSYFIKKKMNYYSQFRVISMVTDRDYLFDPEDGAYMIGSDYYKWLASDEYYEMDPGDVNNPTNYNKSGKETEFPVNIQVFDEGKAVFSENVGARIAGNWTRAGAQKSFRFYARKELGNSKMKYAFFDDLLDAEGEVIKKFDKVTLRNGGNDHILHFRDALIQELAQGLELDYMASEPYILFLNGEFWGFYLLREKPDDYYIKSHYGIDDKDVAVLKNGEVESGSDEDWTDYYEFTIWAASADMTKEENYQKFCQQMDVQSFMDYMTVETYINNYDWASGYTNNWMVWRSNVVDSTLPKADGKWRFILYDLDFSSGLYDSADTTYYHDDLNTNYVDSEEFDLPSILRNLCRNEEFKQSFYDNYVRIMEENFDPGRVSSLIREYVGAYKNVMKDTHKRFGAEWAADCYEDECAKLKTFFRERPKYAKDQLDYFIEHAGDYVSDHPGSADASGGDDDGQNGYGSGQSGNGAGQNENGSGQEGAEGDNVSGQESTNLAPNSTLWYYYGDATFMVDEDQNAFYASVPAKMEETWNIQAGASGVHLENGKKYHIRFDARMDGEGEFELFINRSDGNGGYPTKGISTWELTEERTTYDFYFTWDMESQWDWTVCFNYGHIEGDVRVYDLFLEEMK